MKKIIAEIHALEKKLAIDYDAKQDDAEKLYKDWTSAVLSEDKHRANKAYTSIRMLMDRYSVEPEIFKSKPASRKQFFQYNTNTGRIE